MRTDEASAFNDSGRLRFAAGTLRGFALFAPAVLVADSVYVELAVWHHMDEPYLVPPSLGDHMWVAVPLLVQASLYLVMIRSALRLWGPLMAGSELAQRDVRVQAWWCAGGSALSALMTARVLWTSVDGYGWVVRVPHRGGTPGVDGLNWVGWTGVASLAGTAVLLLGAVAIAVATRSVPKRPARPSHLRLVRPS
ncbi:hypothetical protein [Glycomyces tarimensis]